MQIEESGIVFGDFDENNIYYIEKSEKYRSIKSKGISSVEFIFFRDNHNLLFVEAKKSAPNPANPIKGRFNEFLAEINKKFRDSLEIFERVWMERALTDKFESMNVIEVRVTFVLVINGFKKEWMIPIKEGLEQDLCNYRTIVSLWHPRILVINEQQAISKGLANA